MRIDVTLFLLDSVVYKAQFFSMSVGGSKWC